MYKKISENKNNIKSTGPHEKDDSIAEKPAKKETQNVIKTG